MPFVPKTTKLQQLAEIYPNRILELENIFLEQTNVYIDWANVFGRQDKLKRHIDLKRVFQLFRSFSTIDYIRRYYGTLVGNIASEKIVQDVENIWYEVCTKPVKIMHHWIDTSSLPNIQSPDILKSYMSRGLLELLPPESVEIINQEVAKLNEQGIIQIEEKKCNFDVEIGVDMVLDYERSLIPDYYKVYILWSGDSDFTDIVQKMLDTWKKVYIFATSGKVSVELLQSGATIFDLQKIRDFICRPREMQAQLWP